MPKGKPSAPQGVSAAPIPNGAKVTWSPPASDGGVPLAQYVVVASPGDLSCVVVAPTTECDFLGLPAGSTFTFTVAADNSAGRGPASGATAPMTTPRVPGPPQQVVAQVAKGQAQVNWVPPTDTGGAVIESYVAVSAPGNLTCTTSDLSCTIDGLSNGTTYTFTVTAVNGVGSGPASAPSAARKLLAVPTAPQQVKAKVSGTTATLTWKAPKSVGGAPIKQYQVVSSPSGKKCTTTKLTCRVSGLDRGRSYVFTVQALNARGKGLAGQSNRISIAAPVVTQPAPSSPAPAPAAPDKPEQALT